VVQKAAKRALAKALVVASEQNEFVPRDVDHLRRHRKQALACFAAQVEVLAQRIEHQVKLGFRQMRIAVVYFLPNAGRECVFVDERFVPAPVAMLDDGQCYHCGKHA
jgi:hypothetical protein